MLSIVPRHEIPSHKNNLFSYGIQKQNDETYPNFEIEFAAQVPRTPYPRLYKRLERTPGSYFAESVLEM